MRHLLALFVLLSMAALAGAAEQTPPVNLGASGASLELRLWRWSGTAWASSSVVGLTVTDLTTGEYVIGNLPTAADGERYVLAVALAATPEDALASYEYGAIRGERIGWQPTVDLTTGRHTFRAGDSEGSISLTVTRGLGSWISNPATSATFALWLLPTGPTAFAGESATITGIVLDQTTGTYGATFTYTLQDGDLDAEGLYRGEFTVTTPTGTTRRLPATPDQLTVRVNAAIPSAIE